MSAFDHTLACAITNLFTDMYPLLFLPPRADETAFTIPRRRRRKKKRTKYVTVGRATPCEQGGMAGANNEEIM